ncbi:hypothetical protein C8R44DRAFT_799238 [Mycena epipterygia]|nr:hypothetical protein C8R44DRAFT_799238 [Mycena epipterygia]
MDYTVNSDTFNEVWSTLLLEISETSMALLLYGIYVNLFILAIYTLSRRKTAGRSPLLFASWAMFILGTTGIIVRLITTGISVHLLQEVVKQRPNSASKLLRIYNSSQVTENIIFGINNFVSDTLFLYRCYVIWGSKKKVIILPGMLILCTLATGCLSSAANAFFVLGSFNQTTPYIMGTVTNLVLVGFTAGRIWWIRHETFYLGLDDTFRKHYNTAITIIIESGAIYCICGIIMVIVSWFDEIPIVFGGIIYGIARQGINIMPTLIAIRVGLGHNIQDTIRHGTEKATTRRTPIPLESIQPSEPQAVLHIKATDS